MEGGMKNGFSAALRRGFWQGRWIPVLMAGGDGFVRGAVAMGMQDKG